MAVFTVPIERLGEFELALTRAVRREAIEKGQARAATRTLALLHRLTLNAPRASKNGRRGAVDTGAFLKGWRVTNRGRVTTVENVAPHAPFVEAGRKPGKPPPVDAILPWVRRNLNLRGAKARTVAFLIARAIGRRGLLPRFDSAGALEKIDAIHTAEVERALDRALAQAAR